jgi:peptide/nickel transport system permease protein
MTLRRLARNRKALAGGIILAIFALAAIFAPLIAPGDPNVFVGRPHLAPSSEYWFGTTGSGQDVFAQTVWGTRVSLGVGLLVGIGTTIVGGVVGMTAGYLGRRTDDSLSLVTNVFLIVPSLPLLITLAAFLPAGYVTIVLALTIAGWAWPARVMRAQTLTLREKDFVGAAEISGESRARIIVAEILPNMLSIVAASLVGSVIYGIGAQAGLEFLGLGDTSAVSWGTNLYWASNNAGLLTGAWWTFVPSGACIALVAFALTLMNFALDEITNPRLRATRESRRVLRSEHGNVKKSRATPVVRQPRVTRHKRGLAPETTR